MIICLVRGGVVLGGIHLLGCFIGVGVGVGTGVVVVVVGVVIVSTLATLARCVFWLGRLMHLVKVTSI